MKAFFNKIFLFGIMSMLILSCTKDEVKITASANPTAGALSATATTLILSKDNATKPAVAFNFTAPSFGFDAAVTNTLQFGIKGSNFASAKEVPFSAGVLTKEYTVVDFNAFLIAMKLKTGEMTQVEARLKSQVTEASVAPIYSPVITLSVTPYTLIVPASYVYVPGDYQGWSPSSADSLASVTSNGIYVGVITFLPTKSFQFKITPKKEWNVAYGDAGSGSISTTAGDNLTVPSATSYQLTVDLNAKTIAAVPLSWGLIGSASPGGWDNDTDMTFNNGRRIWSLTVDLKVGEIKFRKNNGWDENFGGSNGTIAAGGDNIPVTVAGNYKVEFDLVNKTYTLTKL